MWAVSMLSFLGPMDCHSSLLWSVYWGCLLCEGLFGCLCEAVCDNKVTSTAKSRTLFWLWCTHGTCLADGMHQTCMWSALMFEQLSIVAPGLGIKEIHVMCLLAGGKGLLHIGICYRLLPALYCLRRPNRCKSVGQYCKPNFGLWQRYGYKIMDCLQRSPEFTPSDLCFSGSLKQHLAGKWLQQMQTWSKVSPLGFRQLTPVSFI
jgi:hypothetical protein